MAVLAIASTALEFVVFETPLGWIALSGCDDIVHRLSFGHPSLIEARAALGDEPEEPSAARSPLAKIAKRIRAYASGKLDDFHDVRVQVDQTTEFQRRVIRACRRIKPGRTMSYSELAAAAGAPGAARAVGNVMASNRTAIIVPCHRVLASGGKLGGFSMRAGVAMKRRLLQLEGWQDQ